MRLIFTGFLVTALSMVSLAQQDGTYQLLWEIRSKSNPKPSYLFGSMHSNDPRLFHFPDSLYTAFVQADAVVLETDLTEIYDEYDVRVNWLNLELFSEDRNYSASRKATKTVYGSEDGRPQFLDAYFQQTGFCADKAFYPLETVEAQMELATDIAFFESFSLPGILVSKENFIEAYLRGDIAALTTYLKTQFRNSPKTYDALITKRNQNMANGLDTLMRKQAVFCAVGSGHLYGADGIIQLLKSKGFQVRSVRATYDEAAQTEKERMLSWRYYPVTDSLLEYRMQFSGKPKELELIGCMKEHLILQELGQGNTYEFIVREDPFYLDDQRPQFQTTKYVEMKEESPFEGAFEIQGLVNDPLKGFQWKYILQVGDTAYELICYGGNKFMHSNRPQLFFSRFNYIGH